MKEQEIIAHLLTGLGLDYDALVTSITMRTEPMSLSELYAHLLSYELRQEHNNSVLQMNSSFSGNQVSRARQFGNSSQGGRDRGVGRGQNTGRGRGRGSSAGRGQNSTG